MSGHWVEDEWEHLVTLVDGTVLKPVRVVLNSSNRAKDGGAYPAVFCEGSDSTGRGLRWVAWEDVRSVHSERKP